MIGQVISVRLKELLEERKVSLYRLAKDTGVAYQALKKIHDHEVTEVKLGTLDRICYALNCEPMDLLVYEPKRALPPGYEQPAD